MTVRLKIVLLGFLIIIILIIFRCVGAYCCCQQQEVDDNDDSSTLESTRKKRKVDKPSTLTTLFLCCCCGPVVAMLVILGLRKTEKRSKHAGTRGRSSVRSKRKRSSNVRNPKFEGGDEMDIEGDTEEDIELGYLGASKSRPLKPNSPRTGSPSCDRSKSPAKFPSSLDSRTPSKSPSMSISKSRSKSSSRPAPKTSQVVPPKPSAKQHQRRSPAKIPMPPLGYYEEPSYAAEVSFDDSDEYVLQSTRMPTSVGREPQGLHADKVARSSATNVPLPQKDNPLVRKSSAKMSKPLDRYSRLRGVVSDEQDEAISEDEGGYKPNPAWSSRASVSAAGRNDLQNPRSDKRVNEAYVLFDLDVGRRKQQRTPKPDISGVELAGVANHREPEQYDVKERDGYPDDCFRAHPQMSSPQREKRPSPTRQTLSPKARGTADNSEHLRALRQVKTELKQQKPVGLQSRKPSPSKR
jgi:hypothetical protein